MTDVASEMSYWILPTFMAVVLGVDKAIIGLIEGAAETTASLLKLISGWLSDRLGQRKALVVIGYSLSALTKPLLAVSSVWWHVLGVRLADRTGKGIRTAPRDAIIADSSPLAQRGRSFGFHRALDTAGAIVGPLLAAGIIAGVSGGSIEFSYRLVFALSVIPGLLAVALLIAYVTERPPMGGATPLSLTLRGFDRRFLTFLAAVLVFTLGNSSDAFLILRSQGIGVALALTPLLGVVLNSIYAMFSTWAGGLSDRIGRKAVIVVGWGTYGVVYLGFALADAPWQPWVLVALYGLYYALAEGTTRAYVADLVPSERRGTAYGVYNATVAIMAFPASLLAGILWDHVSPAAPFAVGAGLAFVATAGLLLLMDEAA